MLVCPCACMLINVLVNVYACVLVNLYACVLCCMPECLCACVTFFPTIGDGERPDIQRTAPLQIRNVSPTILMLQSCSNIPPTSNESGSFQACNA